MASILVTGSSGFIGGRLAARLRKEGRHEVIGLDPRPGPQTNLIGWPSEHVGYKECEVVFHLGALAGVEECERDREGAWRANVVETVRLLHDVQPKVFVYVSSVAATATAPTVYGQSKRLTELIVRLASNKYKCIVAVLPNVYGHGGKGVVSKFFQEPNPVIYGSGDQVREFVYVDDVVEQLIEQAETDIGVETRLSFVSPEGERVSINDLAAMMSRTPKRAPARPFDVEMPVLLGDGHVVTPLASGLRKMRNELEAAGVKHFAQIPVFGSIGG